MTTLRTLLLAASLIGAPSAAHAYVLEQDHTGHPVRWPNAAVTFSVDPSASNARVTPGALQAAAQSAASHWNAATPVQITVSEAPAHVAVGYDPDHPAQNQNTITLANDDWAYDDGVVAVTLRTYDYDTHAILDTDIVLNASQHCFAALPADSEPGQSLCDDLENALTHEMGHALGLAHNTTLDTATMYASSQAGEVSKRHLSADDVNGVEAIYDGAAQADGEPAGGCAAAPGHVDLGMVLLIVLALGLARRRSARRWLGLGALGLALSTGAVRSARAAPVQAPATPARAKAPPMRGAVLVARGHVVSTTAAWVNGMIRTHVVFAVDRCVSGTCRGTAGQRLIAYDAPGGRVGHIEQQLGDDAPPTQGAHLQIALRRSTLGTLRPASLHGAQLRLPDAATGR